MMELLMGKFQLRLLLAKDMQFHSFDFDWNILFRAQKGTRALKCQKRKQKKEQEQEQEQEEKQKQKDTMRLK